MLKTETNTTKMEARVRRAARIDLKIPPAELQTNFEHGQWWITHKTTGAQWSVCDANTNTGFTFEQVTEGEK